MQMLNFRPAGSPVKFNKDTKMQAKSNADIQRKKSQTNTILCVATQGRGLVKTLLMWEHVS